MMQDARIENRAWQLILPGVLDALYGLLHFGGKDDHPKTNVRRFYIGAGPASIRGAAKSGCA
jgi:hypothetical protein